MEENQLNEVKEDQVKESTNIKMWILLLVVVLVIIVGAVVYFFFIGNGNKQEPNADIAFGQETTTNQVNIKVEESEDNVEFKKDEYREVVVEGSNYKFVPSTLEFAAGERVRLVFKSTQGFHDFVIDEFDVTSKRINQGQEDVVEFVVPDTPGTYAYYCSVGNHRQLGMEGELIVR